MNRMQSKAEGRRQKISLAIEENPGYNYQDLLKDTGFPNGILSHHLKSLEKNGLVRVKRKKRMTWFFSPNSNPVEDELRIHLRKETCRKILIYLLEHKEITHKRLIRILEKSPSTVTYTMRNLLESKLIYKTSNFRKSYSLIDPQLTKAILEGTETTSVDTLKDRFADSFSYY